MKNTQSGIFVSADMRSLYIEGYITNVITGSMEIASYMIQNALRYVQTRTKANNIDFVRYRKCRNFPFPRTTFVMVAFQAK